MIKNFLYSLFLHFVLLLIIYANFNLKKVNDDKTSEIAISMIALNGSENSSDIKQGSAAEKEEKKEEEVKKEEIKQPQSQRKSKKNQIKEQPKKAAKSKPAKSVKKPESKEKIEEFKPEEKEELKQEEANKIKDDKQNNENQDEKKNEVKSKEADLGAKEKSNQEQEQSSKQNAKQGETIDLANSVESMDLSAREKFNIHTQLKRCFRRAIDETKLSSKMRVIVKVNISEDGYIDSDIDDLIDIQRYNDPKEINYKIAIDNVKRAINLCSPLRNLPLDKYDIWKEAILEFDEEQK